MRILMVNENPDRSESYLFSALLQEGHEVEVTCDPDAPRRRELEEAGLKVHPLAIRRRLDLPAIRFLRGRIEERQFDVVHAFFKRSFVNVLAATRGLRSRVVVYRGVIGNLSPWNPATRLTFLNPRVRRIVCVCEAVRKSLLALGLPPGRAVTIYKGHSPAWYDNMPGLSLRELGVPEGAFAVTCVANIQPRKGIDDLVRAARLIPDESVHFLLVGAIAGQHLPRLIRRLGLEHRVHLTGFRRDATAITGRSDVFVMPSVRQEGLTRAVIEAMAQRVPPVVTRVGGMPELVTDGECGLIVPPHNPAALAEAITRLRKDQGLRRAMGVRAREQIQNRFHFSATVRQLAQLYREVVEER